MNADLKALNVASKALEEARSKMTQTTVDDVVEFYYDARHALDALIDEVKASHKRGGNRS